jgi:hypothetical protein
MIDFLFVALFQAVSGDPAAAAAPAQTPAEQPAAPAQSPSDATAPSPDSITVTAPVVHCRYQQATGSHFRTRVCTTEAQDRERQEATQRILDDATHTRMIQEMEEAKRHG